MSHDEIKNMRVPEGAVWPSSFSSASFGPSRVPLEIVMKCREIIGQEWQILLVYLVQATEVDQEIRDMCVRLLRRPFAGPVIHWAVVARAV